MPLPNPFPFLGDDMGVDLYRASEWKCVFEKLTPEQSDWLRNNFLASENVFIKFDRDAIEDATAGMDESELAGMKGLIDAMKAATDADTFLITAEIS